mgnify:CR=1 FL=1
MTDTASISLPKIVRVIPRNRNIEFLLLLFAHSSAWKIKSATQWMKMIDKIIASVMLLFYLTVLFNCTTFSICNVCGNMSTG